MSEKILDSVILDCQDCRKKLCEVILVQSNQDRKDIGDDPQFTVFKVLCPFCEGGASSYTDTFFGTTSLGVLDDNFYLSEVETEQEYDSSIKENVIITTLQLKEKNAKNNQSK